MVDWIGLSIPFAYLSILVGSLATFSSLYRKRKAAKSLSLEPWFPPHLRRDIYLSLLHLEPDANATTTSSEKKPPAVPDSVLKAALMQRAAEDITRILSIRNAKPALGTLLARGSVGDELWQRFLRAEKEIEEELRDVVNEANALSPNWGQTIFQNANEMVQSEAIHTKMEELQAQGKTDREWWDQERASIQSKFMKELDDDNKATTTTTILPGGGGGGGGTGGEKPGSDEDAVLVEGGGPAASGSVVSGGAKGSGSTKKRKGKK